MGLDKRQMFAFIAPTVGMSLFGSSLGVLGGVYAKHYGLALTSIGLVILIGRLFDTINDPLIGLYSDYIRRRTGSRKPFIFFGGMLLVLSGYFLLIPPVDVTLMYFAIWYLAFFLALTVVGIPKAAWANEFVTESKQRMLLFSLLALANKCGSLLFFLLPLLPIFSSSEVTPQVLKLCVLVGALILVPGIYCMIKFVPDGRVPVGVNNQLVNKSFREKSTHLFQTLWKNKPFVIYIAAYSFFGLAQSLWGGLFFLFVDANLGLGQKYVHMEVLATLCGFAAVPIWYKLSLWWGKRCCWLVASVIMLASFIYTGLLSPGVTGFYEVLVLRIIVNGMAMGIAVVALSMLGDIIDYGTLRSGVEQNATYFSIKSFLFKTQLSVGIGMGLYIVGWFGFDATAVEHSVESTVGFTVAMVGLPVFFILVSMIFVRLIPIDERRHNIIRQRLDARARRAENNPAGEKTHESLGQCNSNNRVSPLPSD